MHRSTGSAASARRIHRHSLWLSKIVSLLLAAHPTSLSGPTCTMPTKKKTSSQRSPKSFGSKVPNPHWKAIDKELQRLYPAAHCALVHDDPFQLLIATILSAQCTDVRVNLVCEDLFQKYPDPQAFAEATQEGNRGRDSLHRLLPQQGQEHSRRLQESGGGLRRSHSQRHGAAPRPGRSGPPRPPTSSWETPSTTPTA